MAKHGELITGVTTFLFASKHTGSLNFDIVYNKTQLDCPPEIRNWTYHYGDDAFVERTLTCGASLVASPKTKP